MKHLITFLFVASLLVLGFVALNYIWLWWPTDYTGLMKVFISVLVVIFIGTGLAMVFSAGYSRNDNHQNGGKKD
jgi:preprotein translocase subunit SecG